MNAKTNFIVRKLIIGLAFGTFFFIGSMIGFHTPVSGELIGESLTFGVTGMLLDQLFFRAPSKGKQV